MRFSIAALAVFVYISAENVRYMRLIMPVQLAIRAIVIARSETTWQSSLRSSGASAGGASEGMTES